jgi:hypothetical protein
LVHLAGRQCKSYKQRSHWHVPPSQIVNLIILDNPAVFCLMVWSFAILFKESSCISAKRWLFTGNRSFVTLCNSDLRWTMPEQSNYHHFIGGHRTFVCTYATFLRDFNHRTSHGSSKKPKTMAIRGSPTAKMSISGRYPQNPWLSTGSIQLAGGQS